MSPLPSNFISSPRFQWSFSSKPILENNNCPDCAQDLRQVRLYLPFGEVEGKRALGVGPFWEEGLPQFRERGCKCTFPVSLAVMPDQSTADSAEPGHQCACVCVIW